MINRYSNEKIEKIWSDKERFQLYCNLERKILNLYHDDWKHFEIIILDDSDVQEIYKIEKKLKHEMAAIVEFLELRLNDKFVHFSLTSSDILDTAFSVMIGKSFDVLFPKILNLIKQLKQTITDLKGNICLSRTHGKVAELNTISVKLFKHLNKIEFSFENAVDFNELPIKISGPVGNYSLNNSKKFKEIEENLSHNLHLDNIKGVNTQIIPRITYLRYMMNIIYIFIDIDDLVTDLRLLSQSGIEEYNEPFSDEQKGSSSMVHKKNPINLERISGMTRLLKSYVTPLMENCNLWHERDMSHSSVERIIIPDIFHICCHITDTLLKLINKESFDCNQMMENIYNSNGEYMNSYFLNEIIFHHDVSRKEAYEVVKNRNTKNNPFKYEDNLLKYENKYHWFPTDKEIISNLEEHLK